MHFSINNCAKVGETSIRGIYHLVSLRNCFFYKVVPSQTTAAEETKWTMHKSQNLFMMGAFLFNNIQNV